MAISIATPVRADALSVSAVYRADVAGVVSGGVARGARYLDNLDVMADVDLDAGLSWHGAKLHLQLLNNLGGQPNDLAGTLQGINNIEVAAPRAKLIQAWLEQEFADGTASLRAGIYDLNTEFYANDASSLLIAPAFSIGSELSATGPNGPSISPSTALAARVRANRGKFYGQAALLNAHAGTLGDHGGISFSGKDGLLAIAESGWIGARGKLGIGAWRYTRKQPGVVAPGLTDSGTFATSRGAYVIAEHDITGRTGEIRHIRLFGRAGISDGRTTPFRGGWQAGLLIDRLFASREESALSIGINRGRLSRHYRQPSFAGGLPSAPAESGFEITYRDQILPHASLQPDFQYIRRPSGDRSIRDAVVVGLRLQISFSTAPEGAE